MIRRLIRHKFTPTDTEFTLNLEQDAEIVGVESTYGLDQFYLIVEATPAMALKTRAFRVIEVGEDFEGDDIVRRVGPLPESVGTRWVYEVTGEGGE
jgi:hypothetical protein